MLLPRIKGLLTIRQFWQKKCSPGNHANNPMQNLVTYFLSLSSPVLISNFFITMVEPAELHFMHKVKAF